MNIRNLCKRLKLSLRPLMIQPHTWLMYAYGGTMVRIDLRSQCQRSRSKMSWYWYVWSKKNQHEYVTHFQSADGGGKNSDLARLKIHLVYNWFHILTGEKAESGWQAHYGVSVWVITPHSNKVCRGYIRIGIWSVGWSVGRSVRNIVDQSTS